MKNHNKLLEHILKNAESLNEVFGYREIYKIADVIIDATDSGKNYATLKFLQIYCNPIKSFRIKSIEFQKNDPRKYIELKQVINVWRFVLRDDLNSPKKKSLPEKRTNVKNSISNIYKNKIEIYNFPKYYQGYSWNGKHKLFGYPPDSYPNFNWINSLENRFIWLNNNSIGNNTASKNLIQEMIEWGGSQNGVLQKFNDGIGEINLLTLIQDIIKNIDNPEMAIKSSLLIPGLGLTYASKLLRFMKPEKYGALDSRIRKTLLKNEILCKIYDGNQHSMINGYLDFLKLLNNLKINLESSKISKPNCSLSQSGNWRPSEIEMALFCWADDN